MSMFIHGHGFNFVPPRRNSGAIPQGDNNNDNGNNDNGNDEGSKINDQRRSLTNLAGSLQPKVDGTEINEQRLNLTNLVGKLQPEVDGTNLNKNRDELTKRTDYYYKSVHNNDNSGNDNIGRTFSG